jgi:thioredoxin 1
MIAPALEELATELQDKITVAKLNIDESPQTPSKYGVRGVPTLMIFRDGQVAATKVGALPKSRIKEWIESSLLEAQRLSKASS